MRDSSATVLLRWISDSRISSTFQHYVLEDSERCIALWQPAGTIGRVAVGERGGPRGRNMVAGGWAGTYEVRTWTGDGVLRVHRPGQPWSTWRWLSADGWSSHAYVNLESPWRRTPLGFDTADWILDVIAESDGTSSLKDEDELAWALESGKFTADHVARVRAAADEAIDAIQAKAFPFDTPWATWGDLPVEPLAVADGWETLPL